MTIKIEMLEKLKVQKCLDNNQLLDNKKKIAKDWFAKLRDEICASFEKIENNRSSIKKNINFNKKKWERNGGGGGTISVMKGNVFEKVGVNISTVHGEFSKEFRGQIPGAEENGKFWASGISVVSHMCNPYVPAAHMNTRLLVTGEGDKKKIWFGGGGDLTPIFEDKTVDFILEIANITDKNVSIEELMQDPDEDAADSKPSKSKKTTAKKKPAKSTESKSKAEPKKKKS